MKKAMTREEFIDYAHEVLDGEGSMECLYDTITEHNGEVARFGDSWPGAMIRIQAGIDQVTSIERQLARLEGRAPRNFNFGVRYPR